LALPNNPPFRPRSRGRPLVISTERLLAVARDVFLELGIRATTAEVATRAGIAEGTIFHRFKSKEDLFRAAMNVDPDAGLALVEALAARAGSGDLRQTLVVFAQHLMELGRVALPVWMMAWSNPETQLSEERNLERTKRYERLLDALSAFFDAEMQAGRMRQVDSAVLSRLFIGSLHHFCMVELFMSPSRSSMTSQQFAQHAVDLLLGTESDLNHELPTTD
jgi:AcrR family transcriptional regulator